MRHEVDDVTGCDGQVEVERRHPFRVATASGKLGWDERRGIRHVDRLWPAMPPQLFEYAFFKFQILRHAFDDNDSLHGSDGHVDAKLDPPQHVAGAARTQEAISGKVLREPF